MLFHTVKTQHEISGWQLPHKNYALFTATPESGNGFNQANYPTANTSLLFFNGNKSIS